MNTREISYFALLERVLRTKEFIPYLLLQRGPSASPCPVHGRNENLVLAADDPYWRQMPIGHHPACLCIVRQVPKREFQRLKVSGVQDPDAPPILSSTGELTGLHENRMVATKVTVQK